MSLHIKNTNPIKNHIITYKKYQSDLKNQIGILYCLYKLLLARNSNYSPPFMGGGRGWVFYPLSITYA